MSRGPVQNVRGLRALVLAPADHNRRILRETLERRGRLVACHDSPGADEATTLESTRPLRVGDLTVPPGSHTIWVLPTHEMWTLIISKEPSGFHTNYNSSADLGRITFEKRPLDTPVEQLTFAIKKNDAGPG